MVIPIAITVNIEATAIFKQTALQMAAGCGHEAAMRVLLEKGANIEAKWNLGGLTALHIAVIGVFEGEMRYLLDEMADIETNYGKKTIAIANPPVKEVNAIKMELEGFRDAIVNNTDTPVSVVDGFRAMEVAHQILDKIRNATHH